MNIEQLSKKYLNENVTSEAFSDMGYTKKSKHLTELDRTLCKYLREGLEPEAAGDIGSHDYNLMMEIVRMEEDTCQTYFELASKAQNPLVRKVILDILKEEKIHAYEIQVLMKQLRSKEEDTLYKQAEKENSELSN